MSKKVEIDLEALASAISQTILGFAQKEQTKSTLDRLLERELEISEKKILEKKKRGRPKKEKKPFELFGDSSNYPIPSYNEVRSNDEDEVQILNEPAQPTNPIKSFVAPAKVKQIFIKDDKKPTKKHPINIKEQHFNKFHDDGTIAAADRLPSYKYPIPSERRDPVQKIDFTCSICGKIWKDYPSNVPQAFVRLGEGKEASTPIVRCENCVASIIQNRNYKDYGSTE